MPDMTPVEFAALLGGMVVEVESAAHEGLERATKLVQREVRAELGHYQDAAGPFPAWAELAESTKADRVRQGYPENEPGLRSGEMREGIERNVQGRTGRVGSNDDKMVYFELGSAKQPPRATLAGALIRKEEDVARVIGRHFVGRLFGEDVANGSVPVIGDE